MAHTIAINPPGRPALSDGPWASSYRTYSSSFFIADSPTPILLLFPSSLPQQGVPYTRPLRHATFVPAPTSVMAATIAYSDVRAWNSTYSLTAMFASRIHAIQHTFRRAPQTLPALGLLLYHSRNATECAMTDPKSVPIRRQPPASTKHQPVIRKANSQVTCYLHLRFCCRIIDVVRLRAYTACTSAPVESRKTKARAKRTNLRFPQTSAARTRNTLPNHKYSNIIQLIVHSAEICPTVTIRRR